MPSDFYLKPVGILSGASAHSAVAGGFAGWLAGGPLAFTAVESIRRGNDGGRETALFEIGSSAGSNAAAVEQALHHIAAQRTDFAGLTFERPRLMGVVNVTPDSFSDGGRYQESAAAIAHGRALIEAGADILDVGGESTRPGAAPVS